jgi:hypothetical protein
MGRSRPRCVSAAAIARRDRRVGTSLRTSKGRLLGRPVRPEACGQWPRSPLGQPTCPCCLCGRIRRAWANASARVRRSVTSLSLAAESCFTCPSAISKTSRSFLTKPRRTSRRVSSSSDVACGWVGYCGARLPSKDSSLSASASNPFGGKGGRGSYSDDAFWAAVASRRALNLAVFSRTAKILALYSAEAFAPSRARSSFFSKRASDRSRAS